MYVHTAATGLSITRVRGLIVLALLWCAPLCVSAQTVNWPMKPFDQAQPLGNTYGEYQQYGGTPYMHPGIDIMGAEGDSVFAVASGFVKAVLTTSASLHWRVAVGDSADAVICNGFLYAHLEPSSIQVSEGDTVRAGDFLGVLIGWPIAEFHHVHFAYIRQSGFPWSPDWMFIENPLEFLVDVTDTTRPEFQMLSNGSYVAFYANNTTDSYLDPGDTLSGALDFLVSVRDISGHPSWYVQPYQLAYQFRNDSISYLSVVSVTFRDTLFYADNVNIIYRDDAVYDSKGDYDYREFYMICTNTDRDAVIEEGDADSAWFTGDYPNGTYWLSIQAIDRYGSRDDESLQVVLENYFTVQGKVTMTDRPGSQAGTVVSLPQLGLSDTTDAAGDYAIPHVGPGIYTLRVFHNGYDSSVTTEHLRVRDPSRDFELLPVAGLRGDLNHDDAVDASDIIALVSYVFKSGPPPEPAFIGDVNADGTTTSSDIIYLVAYVFKGGPAPPPL